MKSLKSLYVFVMRLLRRFAAATGLLGYLDRNLEKRSILYLRSLFAIYDFEDLAQLDVPWWTFPAISEVEQFLKAKDGTARVFEYGPGASTIWLARRARRVAYVEHDEAFATQLGRVIKDLGSVTGQLMKPVRRAPGEKIECPSGDKDFEDCDFAHYVAAIRDAGGPFDLIVIDGPARLACLAEAMHHLRPGAMILFDDSDRARYQAGLSRLSLRLRRFRGLSPTIPYFEETSLLGPANTAGN